MDSLAPETSPTPPRFLDRLGSGSAAADRPARPRGANGRPRRVGVEVEFTGLPLSRAAEVVRDGLGGRVEKESPYELTVVHDELGPFRLEVDHRLLKRLGRDRQARENDAPAPVDAAEAVLAAGARWLAPLELVTPPLPFDELPRVDRVLADLAAAGAVGGQGSLLHAFGVHYNPEAASLDGAAVLAHVRAFLVLYDWLLEELQVDLSRRVTPFIDPFPREYVVRALDPGLSTDLGAVMDDYLAANPTRNRALDMLPLFAHVDEARVRRAVDDPLIQARPTYHYRLTNSLLGEPGWSLARGWRHWLVVEDLAGDPARLRGMAHEYRELCLRTFGTLGRDWAGRAAEWLR